MNSEKRAFFKILDSFENTDYLYFKYDDKCTDEFTNKGYQRRTSNYVLLIWDLANNTLTQIKSGRILRSHEENKDLLIKRYTKWATEWKTMKN